MDEGESRKYLESKGWGVIPPDQWRIDMEAEFISIWDRAAPFTMTSQERGYSLYKGVEYIVRNNIPGDFIECGVWKGGSCIIIALALIQFGDTRRRIRLYDTFQGMTEPGCEDVIAWNNLPVSEKMDRDRRAGKNSFASWAAGIGEVRRNLALTGYPEENFILIPGDVEETLNSAEKDPVALLRLDTDWYASTLKELSILFPRLVPGGLLVIDDYGHFKGARRAVDEYFDTLSPGKVPYLSRIDYTGRIGINPANLLINPEIQS